ncbi:hypothetical protein C8Q70DRAFT_65379 [Cubamyces menziesii]|nr:hypothetical protein C8Q70DRAFT_65379 [Cubamyces menziesii]
MGDGWPQETKTPSFYTRFNTAAKHPRQAVYSSALQFLSTLTIPGLIIALLSLPAAAASVRIHPGRFGSSRVLGGQVALIRTRPVCRPMIIVMHNDPATQFLFTISCIFGRTILVFRIIVSTIFSLCERIQRRPRGR